MVTAAAASPVRPAAHQPRRARPDRVGCVADPARPAAGCGRDPPQVAGGLGVGGGAAPPPAHRNHRWPRDDRLGHRFPRGGGQRPGGGVALVGVLGHAAGDDRVERDRHAGPAHRRSRRWCVEVAVEQPGQAVGDERLAPGQRLEHHAGQRVDVHSMVGRPPLEALRGHVVDGSDDRPGTGERAGPVRGPRDTEVHQVREVAPGHPVGRGQQHVRGLDVPVHQPGGVRGVQRPGDLPEHVHRVGRAHRAAGGQPVAHVLAVHQAHIDVEPAADLAVVVDRDHMCRPQPGGQLRLGPEPGLELGVGDERRTEPLQRDRALTHRVKGAVHLAHPASADQLVDAVRPEVLSHRRPFRLDTGRCGPDGRTTPPHAGRIPAPGSACGAGWPARCVGVPPGRGGGVVLAG